MNQTFNDQLAAIRPELAESEKTAMVTGTRDAFFDPLSYITGILTESQLQARLASTAVWALDSQIVSAATGMYFEVRSENPECKTMGELVDAFEGTYSYEGFWGEGYARKLVTLLSLQETWHSEASRLNFASGYINYRPKSIQELVVNQQPMRLKENTRKNFEVGAEFVASDGAITKEEALNMLLAQYQERALASAEFRRSLYPAVNCFVLNAKKHVFVGDEPTLERGALDAKREANGFESGRHVQLQRQFSDLDTATKLMMNRVIGDGCMRALSDLAPRLDPSAYLMVMREGVAARKVFTRVVDRLSRDLERERSETATSV